jgi:hypothetical protein
MYAADILLKSSTMSTMKKITLLTSLDEPSDEQLSDLMKEVAQEAKRKALISDQQLRETIAREIIKAQLRFNAQ